MPRIHMKWLAALTLSTLPFAVAAQVGNATPTHSFRFEQGGYEGGAVLSGVLNGHDVDGDGLISSRFGELDSYSLSFKAGTLGRDIETGLVTGDFTQTQMLVTIDIAGAAIVRPEDEGFFFAGTDLSVGTADSEFFDFQSGQMKRMFGHAFYGDGSNLTLKSFTPLVLTAVPVPEPAATAMGAAGLLAVAALARRRHPAQAKKAA